MNITKNSNSIFLFALKKYKNQKAKKCTKNSNNFCHQNSHALFLSHSSEITKQLRRNFKHFSNTRNLVFVSNKSFLNSLLCQLFMLFSSRTWKQKRRDKSKMTLNISGIELLWNYNSMFIEKRKKKTTKEILKIKNKKDS